MASWFVFTPIGFAFPDISARSISSLSRFLCCFRVLLLISKEHALLTTMIPPTTSSISTILLYLAVQVARQVRADPNAPCYFPGGEFAPGYFACQAFNAPVSSCCPAGWTCFSNALCIATTESNSFPNLTLGAVQRGACTNPQWNNNICGSACLGRSNYGSRSDMRMSTTR